MYLAARGAANAAIGSPDTLVAVSPVCAGANDGTGGSAGITSTSFCVSDGDSGSKAGVTAVSLDVKVVDAGVTGGLACRDFGTKGAGLLSLLALGGGGTTSGTGAAGAMVRVAKAVLAVFGFAWRRFKDWLLEFKSAR